MRKSKKVLSIFMVMISLVCCLGMFTACKKKKKDDVPAVVSITASMIELEYETVEFNRLERTPSVVLKNGETVISSTEYSVSYEDNIDVGTAKVKVSANAESTVVSGSAEKSFEIVIATLPDISDLSYAVYNGDSQVPNVLISGTLSSDYDLVWEYKTLEAEDDEYVELDKAINNFVEVGNYRVTATGIGSYQGTKTAVYSIYNPFGNVTLSKTEVNYLTGVSQTPVAIIDGLTEGEDYEISYEYKATTESEFSPYQIVEGRENEAFVNAGEYRVIATGKGIYGGEKFALFIINAQEIPEITMSSGVVYDGNSKTPNYSVGSLTEGKHYTEKWYYRPFDGTFEEMTTLNFVNAGEYKIIAVGFGNYKGTKEKVYTIARAQIQASVSKTNYTFNGDKGKINIMVDVSNAPACTYYYKAGTQTEIGNINTWSEYSLDVDLNVGVYSLFAKIDAFDNYTETTTQIIQFEVYQDELKGIPSSLGGPFTYDGTSKLPQIMVSSQLKASGLVEGVDYTLSWYRYYGDKQESYVPNPATPDKNFVDYGTYICYLYGMGNYKNVEGGSVNYSSNFAIEKADMDKFTVSRQGYVYGQTPTDFVLKGVKGENGAETLGATIAYYVSTTGGINAEWTLITKDTVLDAGIYYVRAKASGLENYNDKSTSAQASTGNRFVVAKANLEEGSIIVSIADNDVNTLAIAADAEVVDVLDEATITYYYYQNDDIDNAIVLEENTVLESGTYKIYAVVSGMKNYNNFATDVIEVVVEESAQEPEQGEEPVV